MSGRKVPGSAGAEVGLIGCCILDRGVLAESLAAGVRGEAFMDPRRGLVWECLRELHNEGVEVDEVVLGDRLEARGQGWEAGDVVRVLSECTGAVESVVFARNHREIVVRCWKQRQVIRAGMELVEAGYRNVANLGELVAGLGEPMGALYGIGSEDKGVRLVDVLDGVKAEMESAAGGQGDFPDAIHWPVAGIDEAFLPLSASAGHLLVLLAARPSVGKSALARQVVSGALEQGKRVVVFLLETTSKTWLRQLAGLRAECNVLPQVFVEEPPERQRRFFARLEELRGVCEKQLWCFEGDLSLEAIESRCRLLKAQAGAVDLIVVDYVQLVRLEDAPREREEQVARISRQLKLLAKELGTVCLALVQINRESEKGKREPMLSDLRESGALEQDADRVLFLHQPAQDHNGNEQGENRAEVEVNLIQAKFRDGPKGKRRLNFRRQWVRFYQPPGGDVGGAASRAAAAGQRRAAARQDRMDFKPGAPAEPAAGGGGGNWGWGAEGE